MKHWIRIIAGVSACVGTTPLGAQISFAWPAAAPDIRTYDALETCLAHVKNAAERMPRRAFDTLETIQPRPVRLELQEEARRCVTRFTVDQLTTSDRMYINTVENTFVTLLGAGRTNDAQTVLSRWFASVGANEDSLRYDNIFRFFKLGMAVPPPAWDIVWSLERVYQPTDWERRNNFVAWIFQMAYHMHRDTAEVSKAAKWLVQTSAELHDSIMNSPRWRERGAGNVYLAQQYLLHPQLMDSLRYGTQTYYHYLNAIRTRAKADRPNAPRPAQPVLGEYWFPAKPSAERPARGSVSVVIATPDNECGGCRDWTTIVRRWHRRFPDLQLTLLAKTRGHYGTVIEPSAADAEARLIDSVYRVVHRLPATVVVNRTEFVRVEDPDRRRLNMPGLNDKNYPTMAYCGIKPGTTAYLIDRDGNLIWQFCLDAQSLDRYKFEDMLEAVVRQERGRSPVARVEGENTGGSLPATPAP